MTQPWHTLTPHQQQWAWQQHYAQQQLAVQRQQAADSKRVTGNVLWLLLGVPAVIVALLVLASVLTRAIT